MTQFVIGLVGLLISAFMLGVLLFTRQYRRELEQLHRQLARRKTWCGCGDSIDPDEDYVCPRCGDRLCFGCAAIVNEGAAHSKAGVEESCAP